MWRRARHGTLAAGPSKILLHHPPRREGPRPATPTPATPTCSRLAPATLREIKRFWEAFSRSPHFSSSLPPPSATRVIRRLSDLLAWHLPRVGAAEIIGAFIAFPDTSLTRRDSRSLVNNVCEWQHWNTSNRYKTFSGLGDSNI